jgi:hypothetical protein
MRIFSPQENKIAASIVSFRAESHMRAYQKADCLPSALFRSPVLTTPAKSRI